MEPVVPVYVSLWSDDDPHLEGRVLELDPERMQASFPVARQASWFALGRQVRLQFALPGSPRKATSQAWVQAWYVEAGEQVYELRFCDEAQVQLEVLSVLGMAFNRREVYRARPTARQPIGVRVRGTPRAPAVDAQLLDLSIRGASLALDCEEGFGGDGLTLQLELLIPDQPPLELACRIIHRQLLGTQVCYGLEFDAHGSEGFDAKREELARCVRELESEELRRRAG